MRLRTLQLLLTVCAVSMLGQDVFARGGGGGGRGGFGGGGARGGSLSGAGREGGFGGERGGMNAGGYRGGANNSAVGRNGEFNGQHNTSNLFRNNSALNNAARNDFNNHNWGNYGGYGGYGYGYGGWGGYGGFGLGVGLGYGLGGVGGYGTGVYNTGVGTGYGYGNVDAGPIVNNPYDTGAANAAQPADANSTQPGIDYAAQGETNFHAGRYKQAITDFRHAMIDDPSNGGILMVLGQALLQTGDYRNAAGATEAAIGMLPEDKWGAAVENYAKLYGNTQDYTNQLKSLEAARNEQPNDPALRFLLGFNFGYLGYPKQAVRELDKAVQLEGRDPAARKLHDIFAAKIDAPLVGPPPKSEQPAAPAASANHPARIPAAEIGLPAGG